MKNKTFELRKKVFLRKLEDAINQNLVDNDVLPVLSIINSFPFAYTTSSCSGRIMLIDVPIIGKKNEAYRIKRWHDVITFDEFWSIITEYKPKGIVWFRVEALIIALAVDSINWASYLLRLARILGLKESGIRSITPTKHHIILDFTGTENLNTPIADRDHMYIDKESGKFLVNLANRLLIRTKKKLNLLKLALNILKEYIDENSIENPDDIGFRIYEDLFRRNQ
ncbi:MAG: tRNA-wybutosine modification methyltransferase TYW3 [Candidatus Njordarchaeales archaeon]